jgi:hypothetical protein
MEGAQGAQRRSAEASPGAVGSDGEYSTKVPQQVRIWRDADRRSGTVTCGDGRQWTCCLLFASRGSGVRVPFPALVRIKIRTAGPRVQQQDTATGAAYRGEQRADYGVRRRLTRPQCGHRARLLLRRRLPRRRDGGRGGRAGPVRAGQLPGNAAGQRRNRGQAPASSPSTWSMAWLTRLQTMTETAMSPSPICTPTWTGGCVRPASRYPSGEWTAMVTCAWPSARNQWPPRPPPRRRWPGTRKRSTPASHRNSPGLARRPVPLWPTTAQPCRTPRPPRPGRGPAGLGEG